MDYLWTPWRYKYISSVGEAGECVFCVAAESDRDEENFVVHRAEHNFIILNRFPYTSGHVMVVPDQHVATLLDLPEPVVCEMMLLGRRCEQVLRQVYRPEGLNLGINLGRCAGAGIAGHLHLHALPRWVGDSNFMTTIGETRVVPEDLSETWAKLRRGFGQLQD